MDSYLDSSLTSPTEKIQIWKIITTVVQILFIIVILAFIYLALPKQSADLLTLKDRSPALRLEDIRRYKSVWN